MSENQYLPLNEAALLVDKSTQTIRRLIKLNKVKFRRKRTPQGFNYYIDKNELIEFYKNAENFDFLEKPKDIRTFKPEEIVQSKQENVQNSASVENENMEIIKEEKRSEEGYFKLNGSENAEFETEISEFKTIPEELLQEEIELKTEHEIQSSNETDESDNSEKNILKDYIKTEILEEMQKTMRSLIDQHSREKQKMFEEKDRQYEILKMFQDRIINLESELKQLKAPPKNGKKWFEFWRLS